MKNQKIKLYLFLILLSGILLVGFLFPRLTLPFGFSYIVYLMTKPLTLRLTTGKRSDRVKFFLISTFGLGLFFLPLFVTLYNTEADFSNFSSQLVDLEKMIADHFFQLKVRLFEEYGIKINIDPVKLLTTKLGTMGAQFVSFAPSLVSSLFEWLLLVPMFLYFFYVESNVLSKKLMKAVPNQIFEKSYVLLSQFNTKFSDYVVAKFVEATIVGSLITLGLWLVDFPYAFVLGLLAGITNILPYIGPIIGFVPALLIGLLSKDPAVSLTAMMFVYAIANLVDMILVFPLLVSRIVNLHPIVVVVSVIIGSQLGGVIGMIVIIPIVAFIQLFIKEIYKDLAVHL